MIKPMQRVCLSVLLSVVSQGLWAQEQTKIPLAEIQSFVETFETINQGYVEALSDKAILQKALKGMVAALDPHSEYLTKEEIDKFQELTSGNYAGIGVEVEMLEGKLIVVSPIDGSPAAKAGIKPGDVIVRIDGTLINGIGLQEVVMLMRGELGTTVELDIERDGDITHYYIERDLVASASLTRRWLGEDVAYIRISQFQGDTAEEFRQTLRAMQQEQTLSGLVLDLRNNPGGVLQSAVGVVDAFIDNGVIVYTDGRHAASKSQFKATSNTLLINEPVVVLVNEGSASASEIVAGALQDHKRAAIMGTETFGKGSVQTVVPLSDGSAVKLTTALYFTPNGRSIQAQGILPDMFVPQVSLVPQKKDFFVKEAELSGHLENASGGRDRVSADVDRNIDVLAFEDFQLYQAYTILRAFPQLLKR